MAPFRPWPHAALSSLCPWAVNWRFPNWLPWPLAQFVCCSCSYEGLMCWNVFCVKPEILWPNQCMGILCTLSSRSPFQGLPIFWSHLVLHCQDGVTTFSWLQWPDHSSCSENVGEWHARSMCWRSPWNWSSGEVRPAVISNMHQLCIVLTRRQTIVAANCRKQDELQVIFLLTVPIQNSRGSNSNSNSKV